MARVTWIHNQTFGLCGPEVTSKRIHTCKITLDISLLLEEWRNPQFVHLNETTLHVNLSLQQRCSSYFG